MTRHFFARAPEGALRPLTLSLTRALFAACSLLGACHSDFDPLFEAQALDSDGGQDAGMVEPPPAQLIELWKDKAFSSYSESCAACAAAKCGAVNESCKRDPQCVAFTRCVAQSTDPVTQAQCRSQFATWLSADVFGRDVGGPYAQCVLQDKCTEECASRVNFSCVGKFSWQTTNDMDIPFRFRFNEAFLLEEVAGMEVKVCRADDLYCTAPTQVATTDDNGEVTLMLRTSLRTFQGYLELNKKTADPMTSIYPTLLRLGWPITVEGVTNITVINEFSVSLNVAISNVAPDPNRGLLQVRFSSCSGFSSPGVSFATNPTDEASRTWYADLAGVPNFEETKTYMLGAAGVINAIEGRHNITASYSPDNGVTNIPVAEAPAPVRAGFMTIVVVPPMGTN